MRRVSRDSIVYLFFSRQWLTAVAAAATAAASPRDQFREASVELARLKIISLFQKMRLEN